MLNGEALGSGFRLLQCPVGEDTDERLRDALRDWEFLAATTLNPHRGRMPQILEEIEQRRRKESSVGAC